MTGCARRVRGARRRPQPRPDRWPRWRRAMYAEGGLGLVDPDGLALLVPQPGALDPDAGGPAPPLPDVDATRFDVGDPPCPRRRRALPTATTPRPSPRSSTRATPTPRVLLRAGDRRTDPRRRVRGRAHAGEDDVLRTQAAHRHGHPQPRRLSASLSSASYVDVPDCARVEQGAEVARAVALRRGRELALHLELVARPLDVAEHADRRRASSAGRRAATARTRASGPGGARRGRGAAPPRRRRRRRSRTRRTR